MQRGRGRRPLEFSGENLTNVGSFTNVSHPCAPHSRLIVPLGVGQSHGAVGLPPYRVAGGKAGAGGSVYVFEVAGSMFADGDKGRSDQWRPPRGCLD